MTTAKQRAWRKKFARMYGGKRKRRSHSQKRVSHARSRRRVTMARRRYGRRRSRRRGSNLLSVKNLIGTAGGAMVAGPVGAAAGAYLVGKSGVMGALAGYFLGSQLASMASGVLGGMNLGGSNSGGFGF